MHFSWKTTGYAYCFVTGKDDWADHIGGPTGTGPTSYDGILDAWALSKSIRQFQLFCKDPKYETYYDRADTNISISGFPAQFTPSQDSSYSSYSVPNSQAWSRMVSWYGKLVASAGNGSSWFCSAGFCDSEWDANNFIDDFVSKNPKINWPAVVPLPCNVWDTFAKMLYRRASDMKRIPAERFAVCRFTLEYACSATWTAASFPYAWPIDLGNGPVCTIWDTSCPTVSATTNGATSTAPTIKDKISSIYQCYRGVPWSEGELDWWTRAITDGTHTLAGLKAWLKTEGNGANASKSDVCDQ